MGVIILIFLIVLLCLSLMYLTKNLYQIEDINESSNSCLSELQPKEYVKGEVIVYFIQDVTKDEIDELLSSYNLSSDEIKYPPRNDYRVDFVGDTDGFLEYLNETGFSRQNNRNPNLFLFTAKEGINCKIANEIFYSYPNVSVTSTYCFGNVWGVVKVKEGTEKEWACKLRNESTVENTELNGIVHTN